MSLDIQIKPVGLDSSYNPDVLTCLANLSNDEVFTPPSLANEMLDQLPDELWSDPNAKFLDPVSKSGVFLREIAKRLMDGLETQIPDTQERINHIYTMQLFGMGITELTALLTRRSLYCSKYANGKYSIVTAFDDEDGNVDFEKVEHKWFTGNCVFCGASEAVYNRGEELETHAYKFIHTNKPEGFYNMQFDVIIGNPPYQLSDGGNGASASPLYNRFVEQAKKLNPRYLTMIIPSRWFAGGKGLDDFRSSMLGDSRVRSMTDFVNAKEVFPGVSIGGGVNYFLWDRDNKGLCNYTTVLDGKSDTLTRKLDEFPVFVRYNKALSIIEKVQKIDKENIVEMITSRNPFGLPSSARGRDTKTENSVSLYSSKGIGYVHAAEVTSGKHLIDKYKVMISKVTGEHAGEPDKQGTFRILSRMEVLKPKEVCTDSYLTTSGFDTENEARNFYNYLRTKFARVLLMQAVSSINLSREKFYFIPMQDFTQEWDDQKLYTKYGLSDDEISFIDSIIKPMESN